MIKTIKLTIISLIDWAYAQRVRKQKKKELTAIKRCFKGGKPINLEDISLGKGYDSEILMKQFIYKDEDWNYIKYLDDYRKQMRAGRELKLEDNLCHGERKKYRMEDNRLIVNTKALRDNWLCFILNDFNVGEYLFSFDAEIYSEFTELQIAFRYKNLGNRYRFMIRNNQEAVFECVYNGEFYHSLWQKPYHLELGKKYRISVAVLNKQFLFYIDDELFFSIKEKKQLVSGENLCLILWNKGNSAPIQCTLNNFKLEEICKFY